jgi:hypothetical protein
MASCERKCGNKQKAADVREERRGEWSRMRCSKEHEVSYAIKRRAICLGLANSKPEGKVTGVF